MSRGRTIVRDPAVAIALAKCWISRWGSHRVAGGIAVDSFHPRDCEWCEKEPDFLISAIEEFLEWSQLRVEGAIVPKSVSDFLIMSSAEQAEAVHSAQGY